MQTPFLQQNHHVHLFKCESQAPELDERALALESETACLYPSLAASLLCVLWGVS